MADNPTVYEVLGDAYKETGNSEKAETAYTRWIERRQKEIEAAGAVVAVFHTSVKIAGKTGDARKGT